MFHDDLIKNDEGVEGVRKWHGLYHRLAGAVEVAHIKFLEVIKEVERCAQATGKDIHAVTVMLMYEFAESIDGVTILTRAGAAQNCIPLLRKALEIGLGVRYILEDEANYERRSLSYEYFHHLNDLKWAQRSDPDHEIGKQLRTELKGDAFADVFDVTDKGIDTKNEIAMVEKKTNSSRYNSVRLEMERIKNAKKKARKDKKETDESSGNWFSLWNGPKNVQALAKWVGMLSTYEVLYRTWSNSAHGEGALKRIGKPKSDGMNQFDPIRNPVGLHEKCRSACDMTTAMILTVVDKVIPELREELRVWYVEKMKPARVFIETNTIEEA